MTNTTARFDKAYNALVQAFFNGTLAKGTCTACAVGNIVADAQGGEIKKVRNGFRCTTPNGFWGDVFHTQSHSILWGLFRINSQCVEEDATVRDMAKIETLTGYTADEMAQIEYAFERNTLIKYSRYNKKREQSILEDQYNGLCAVVDVMLKLDGIADNGHKAKFREHKSLQSA